MKKLILITNFLFLFSAYGAEVEILNFRDFYYSIQRVVGVTLNISEKELIDAQLPEGNSIIGLNQIVLSNYLKMANKVCKACTENEKCIRKYQFEDVVCESDMILEGDVVTKTYKTLTGTEISPEELEVFIGRESNETPLDLNFFSINEKTNEIKTSCTSRKSFMKTCTGVLTSPQFLIRN